MGRLPYGWITDATRRGYFVNTFSDASEFVRRMAAQALAVARQAEQSERGFLLAMADMMRGGDD